MKDDYLKASEAYVDRLFGAGSGAAHSRFLDKIQNRQLRELVHRFHTLEADEEFLSLEENYLIGVCVLCASGSYATAAMFTKILLHLGTDRGKILAALGRLPMWSGGLQAVEATFAMQRAIREFDDTGLDGMQAWFPKERR